MSPFLDEQSLNLIRVVPIPKNSKGANELIWKGSVDGNLKLTYAYAGLIGNNSSQFESRYVGVWWS